jgi:hypothetical protein
MVVIHMYYRISRFIPVSAGLPSGTLRVWSRGLQFSLGVLVCACVCESVCVCVRARAVRVSVCVCRVRLGGGGGLSDGVFGQSQIDLPAFAADWFILSAHSMRRKRFVVTRHAARILFNHPHL